MKTEQRFTKLTVEDAVLGLVLAIGPVCIDSMMSECHTQVGGFEKLSECDRVVAIEGAINQLVKARKITMEISTSDNNGSDGNPEYIVVFS